MRNFAQLRTTLETKKKEITRRVTKIETDIRHAEGPVSADWEEQAIEMENDEVLNALDDSGRAELLQIQAALKKMEQGQYGICENCGRAITMKRLAALPYVARCMKCSA